MPNKDLSREIAITHEAIVASADRNDNLIQYDIVKCKDSVTKWWSSSLMQQILNDEACKRTVGE